MLREMQSAGVAPDVYCFSAAVSACARAAKCEEALALFDDMEAAGVAPNVVTYNAAISACETGQWWEHALGLFRRCGPSAEPKRD